MRRQIVVASTFYGAATIAAAVDAGLLGDPDERILVTSNNANVPEAKPDLPTVRGFDLLARRFDRVVSYNDFCRPFHPSTWQPRDADAPVLERALRGAWDLGDAELELVVESIQVPPALALMRMLPDAAVTVYADGLMSYGPTRTRLDRRVAGGVRRLIYLDLVPGLTPLLLSEVGTPGVQLPSEPFVGVLRELAEDYELADEPPHGGALILGQPLTALGILSEAEEMRLHEGLLAGVAALGHTEVVFKPHPTALARLSDHLRDRAGRLGVRLHVLEDPILAEVLYHKLEPALVVSCYSTGLLTAARYFGIKVATLGTDLVLRRLKPFENSNRVPVIIAGALLPDVADADAVHAWTLPAPGDERNPAPLVEMVGYAMQPWTVPHLRERAIAHLRAHSEAARYLTPRKLALLGLPGGRVDLSPVTTGATARKVLRDKRVRRALGPLLRRP